MNETFVNNLAMIQADLACVESLLPAGIVNQILNKAEGTLDESAVVKYKGASLVYLRNGWLWYLLRKVLMPVRMMRRSFFNNSSGLTVSAVIYAIFLSFIWMLILNDTDICKTFFFFVWTGIILSALLPYIVALVVLIRNRDLYAGAKRTFTGGAYYGEK